MCGFARAKAHKVPGYGDGLGVRNWVWSGTVSPLCGFGNGATRWVVVCVDPGLAPRARYERPLCGLVRRLKVIVRAYRASLAGEPPVPPSEGGRGALD